MRTIGFVAALPAEAATLTRRKNDFGTIAKLPAAGILMVSGAGAKRAEAAANLLLEEYGAVALASWGCAAAVAMDLEPGALVIPSRIVGAEGEVFAVASDWRARLAARLGAAVPVTDGALAESLSVVVDVAAKQAIRQATGAVATDMESAALARVAQRQGVPFIAIRSIADSAAMRLPEPVCRALKPRGDVYLGKMLGYAFRDPAQFLELARLGRAFGRAMATLRKVAAIAGPDIGFPQSRADAADFVSSFS